jgi:uncharacterized protein YkwD
MRPRETGTPKSIVALAATTAVALLVPTAGTAHATECEKANKPAYELSLKGARKAIGCLINEHRDKANKGKLETRDSLDKAAQRHTRKMANDNCFAHQCPGEGSLLSRLLSVGYILNVNGLWGYAENIAWGAGTNSSPRVIVRAWMNSPPHRANILNGRYDHMGIGMVDNAPTSGWPEAGTYTIDFGYRG